MKKKKITTKKKTIAKKPSKKAVKKLKYVEGEFEIKEEDKKAIDKLFKDAQIVTEELTTNTDETIDEATDIDLEKFKADIKKDLIEEIPDIPKIPSIIEDVGFNVSRRNIYSTKGTKDKVEGDAKKENNVDIFKIDKSKPYNQINKSIFNMNK